MDNGAHARLSHPPGRGTAGAAEPGGGSWVRQALGGLFQPLRGPEQARGQLADHLARERIPSQPQEPGCRPLERAARLMVRPAERSPRGPGNLVGATSPNPRTARGIADGPSPGGHGLARQDRLGPGNSDAGSASAGPSARSRASMSSSRRAGRSLEGSAPHGWSTAPRR